MCCSCSPHSVLGHQQGNLSAPLTVLLLRLIFSFPHFAFLNFHLGVLRSAICLVFFLCCDILILDFPSPISNHWQYSFHPRQCLKVAGKVCQQFLSAADKDSHKLCTDCCGKSCYRNDRCDCCLE